MADGTGFGRVASPGRGARAAELALDLSARTITLMARDPGGAWGPVADVAIDGAEFAQRIDWLRAEALVRGGPGRPVALWLPGEQVLVRRAFLPSGGAARVRAARALVEGSSIYRAADLAIAIAPPGADGRSVVLATLAQTWREARDYAGRWGFVVGAVSTRVEAAAFGAPGPAFALAAPRRTPRAAALWRAARPAPGLAWGAMTGLGRVARVAAAGLGGVAARSLVAGWGGVAAVPARALVAGLGGVAVVAAALLAWPAARPWHDAAPMAARAPTDLRAADGGAGPLRAMADPLPHPATAAETAPSPVRLTEQRADIAPPRIGPGPVLPQRPLLPGAALAPADQPPSMSGGAAPYARQPAVAPAGASDWATAPDPTPGARVAALDAPGGALPPGAALAHGSLDPARAGGPGAAPGRRAGAGVATSTDASGVGEAALDGTRIAAALPPLAGAAGAPGRAPVPPAIPSAAPPPAEAAAPTPARVPLPVPRPATAHAAPNPALSATPAPPAATAAAAPEPAPVAAPPPVAEEAPDAGPASRFARASAPVPPIRPRGLRTTLPSPSTASPRVTRLPTPGRTPTGVQQLATEQGLPSNRTALVGILNLQGGRRALLRLPDGSFERVGTGDMLDGWRVSLIGRDALRLTKGGEDRTLLLIDR